MKVLIIPDVHGSHNWEIAKEKIDEVDFVVFLGDYGDSWENNWPDQGENVKAIFDFKRKHPDKVKVLLGNHDWSYISGSRYGSNCSGHQTSKITEIRSLFTANLDIIDLRLDINFLAYVSLNFHSFLPPLLDNMSSVFLGNNCHCRI